jgi:hypothetical protein
VVAGECGERRVGIIPKVEILLSPPLHQSGHGDVKIRINSMPEPNMNNHAPLKFSVPHPGPMNAGRGRNSSTGLNGGQSPYRPRTESRRSRCAGSPRGSDCVAAGIVLQR